MKRQLHDDMINGGASEKIHRKSASDSATFSQMRAEEVSKELPTAFHTSPILDLHKVVQGIKDHQRNMTNCRQKAVAFVLGTTGAGKTTTLCWMLGKPPKMQKVREKVDGRERIRDVMIVEDPPEGLEVGHDKFTSKTRHLRSFKDPMLELLWVDTPGWGDTEGSEVDISNAVAITHTMHSCQSVRPILLISAKALPTERGRYLRSLVSLVSRFITGETSKNIKAVQVFFTHVDEKNDSDELWFLFGDFLREVESEPEVVAFVKHVQASLDRHKEKLLLRPTEETPDVVKALVWSISPIENVEEVFGCPLSSTDREKLIVACDQLVQEVRDSLRDLDFMHLLKVLDTLQLLVKTSNMDMVLSAYQIAGQHVLDDLHGKLTAASRNFEENNFEPTRQQLEEINKALLVHTSELESEQEKRNPNFASIQRRREALVFQINNKVAQLKICCLPIHGSEDFPQLQHNLDILRHLSNTLKSQLFPENQDSYTVSVQVLAGRIGEYKDHVQTVLESNYLGFDKNLISECVHPDSNSDIKTVTYLSTSLLGLRRSTIAAKGHVQEELLTLYDDHVRTLETMAEGCETCLMRKLQLLDESQVDDVKSWVDDLLSILLVPWVIHAALAEHVNKTFAQLYLKCLTLLEEHEAKSLAPFNDSLELHDFQTVALNLRRLDVVRQTVRRKTVGDRFKDRCIRTVCKAETLVVELEGWIPKQGVHATSDVFSRVGRDLELLQKACTHLPPYLEDVRSSCYAPKSCDTAELSVLLKQFIGMLQTRIKVSLDSAVQSLGEHDYGLLHEHICFLEEMWPLRSHISQMQEDYALFVVKMQTYASNLCKSAAEASSHSNAGFDPSRVKELLDLVDGLAKVLFEHAKGFLFQIPTSMSSSSGTASSIPEHAEVRQMIIRNIETKISNLEESVKDKVSGAQFEAPVEELSLLRSMLNPLHAVIGERAATVLQQSVTKVDNALSSSELKFRTALANEHLQDAELIITGTVQKILQLQDCIPRVEGVSSQMQRELTGRKDCFVQKVNDLLSNKLYADLNVVLHGGKRQLSEGTAEDAKRWRDSLALLNSHFRVQYDGARSVLREVRMSSPVHLGGVNFSRVIDFVMTLDSIWKTDADGARLTYFLTEYDMWCTNLTQENKYLLSKVAEAGRRALSKWKFCDMERICSDMKMLSNVPLMHFGDSCEQELRSLDREILHKVESLRTDLDAMISYGYHEQPIEQKSRIQPESEDEPGEEAELRDVQLGECGDPSVHQKEKKRKIDNARCGQEPLKCICQQCEFRCVVFPWRIDMMFDGLRAAIDCPLQHDFDQIYEQMLMYLDKRVGSLYGAVKIILRQGNNMEAAEKLMHGAALLQSNSVTVSTKTAYNMDKHSKLIEELSSRKEEFITKSRARQDPQGFKQQLDELKDADYSVYVKKFSPLMEEIVSDSERLLQQIACLELDEDQLEFVINGIRNQYLFSKAIAGHGDADSCFQQLLKAMKKMLRKVTIQASEADASSQVHQAEKNSQFLLAALELLKASKIPDFVELAKTLEPTHTELVENMNQRLKKTRDGWKLVEHFDICKDNPPVSQLIGFMEHLRTRKIRLNGTDAQEISFQAAVSFVKRTVANLNLEPLWIECMTPLPGGQDARLAIALTNLQLLAKNLPDIGMAEVYKNMVNYVCNLLKDLQTQIIAQFEHVQKSRLTEGEERSQWKRINQLLEGSAQVKCALGRFTDIFPSGEEDQSVECMKKAVTEMHNNFGAHRSNDISSIVHHLVSVFKVSSSVSNPAIGKHVHSLIESFLETLRREKVINFGELGNQLCCDTALGGQLVEEFDQFKQFKHELFSNKTAGLSFVHAMDQLVKLNHLNHWQQGRLRACWSSYKQKYDAFLDSHMFRGPEGLYDEVKRGMSAYNNQLANAPNIPELLAGICAALSLNMSDLNTSAESSGVNRKFAMMHPHPVQVLALFRLLRADHPPRSWASNALHTAFKIQQKPSDESHLIQISTGEGKSIVLGVLSIFLSLCGYAVDCVCYSKYLSDRDYAAFKQLFIGFGVDDLVEYGTFSQLARRHVNQAGDVRVGTKALVEDKLMEGTVQPSQKLPKILLIDEVDVFFSQDFYGALYRPSVLIQEPAIKHLQSFIWENRGPGLTLQSVQASPAYTNFQAQFLPRWQRLMDSHIRSMIHATTTYDQPEHAYEVEGGRIGYVEHGTVNTTFRHGYNTTFCYFQEQMRGAISEDVFNEFMGLDIRCGSFSYAEIPLAYERILGVTGTLESLGQFERSVIRDVYNICQSTITPSMYGIRDSSFDKGVHIEFGLREYHRKILDEITDMQDAERPVLVFFESEATLEEFQKSEYGERLPDMTVVTSGTGESIYHYVKQATRSKEVTLFPRVFGRGLDFVCYDKLVTSRGGVAVVQTFLSEDISEEIQIKGRTCRQGEKGSYKMILLGENIIDWNEDKEQESQRKADRAGNAARTPFATKQELEAATGASLYALLDQKRKAWFMEQSRARQRVVNAAKEQHKCSSKFQELLSNPNTAKQADLISMLSDMNRGVAPSNQYHIVFCLDESGSMEGDPWAQLIQAFQGFIQVCIDHGDGGDLISIVQFSNKARSTLQRASLQQASQLSLQMVSGGTCFQPALQSAYNLLQSTPSLVPMLVFMSDGKNSDGDVTDILQQMSSTFSNLQCHAVFFGRAQGSDRLQQMAAAVPDGKFHLSVDGLELNRTFSSIAADVTAL